MGFYNEYAQYANEGCCSQLGHGGKFDGFGYDDGAISHIPPKSSGRQLVDNGNVQYVDNVVFSAPLLMVKETGTVFLNTLMDKLNKKKKTIKNKKNRKKKMKKYYYYYHVY